MQSSLLHNYNKVKKNLKQIGIPVKESCTKLKTE